MLVTRPTTNRRRSNRLTHAQRLVMELIRNHPTISYDEIAARLQIDRNTAIRAVVRLILERRVVKIAGAGRQPNRYLATDSLFSTRPGYKPTPVILSEQARWSLVERWAQARGVSL
jgi:predicted ArsR family transcriptional regulator